MATVTKASTNVTATVRVHLTDAPATKVQFLDREIMPDFAVITYTYTETLDTDGWTNHAWLCGGVNVSGYRVLKPGLDGTVRVGKDSHQTRWSQYAGKDLCALGASRPELPDWLAIIIDELRPSGDVRTV